MEELLGMVELEVEEGLEQVLGLGQVRLLVLILERLMVEG